MPSSIGGVPNKCPEGALWFKTWGGDGVEGSDFMTDTPLLPKLDAMPGEAEEKSVIAYLIQRSITIAILILLVIAI